MGGKPVHAASAAGRGSRPHEEPSCPYCGLRMYEVPVRSHPEFEVLLCYACGGCMVFDSAAATAPVSRQNSVFGHRSD